MKDTGRAKEDAWLVLSLTCEPKVGGGMKARRRRKRRVVDDGVFECKTCYKQFRSFQALGGHRTSHNRPPLGAERGWKLRPVLHRCGICGQEFPRGQALGGHMRGHKKAEVAAAATPGDLFPDGAGMDVADYSEKDGLHGVLLELFV